MNITSSINLYCGGPGSGRHSPGALHKAAKLLNKHGYSKVGFQFGFPRVSTFKHKAGHKVEIYHDRAGHISGFHHERGDSVDNEKHTGHSTGHNIIQLEDRLKEVHSGGPGSGRKKGSSKKPWSKMSEEERREAARKDPRQMRLFK